MNSTNLMTVDQVANMLQMSTDAIYRMAARREIGSYKIGNLRRFSMKQIEEWLENCRERSEVELREIGETWTKSHPLLLHRKTKRP